MNKKYVFGFDYDGVLTKPEKRIPNPTIANFIASQLNQERPIAIITGRTPSWLKRDMIPLIESGVRSRKDLDFLYVSCEKATVTLTYQAGEMRENVVAGLAPPENVRNQIKLLGDASSNLFFDDSKINIVSLEIVGGTEEEVRKQKNTLQKMLAIIEKDVLAKENDFVVLDEPGIALDIQHKLVDKTNAALGFINFVRNKKILKPSFIIFGDTISDVNFAKRLWNQGNLVTLAYVGIRDLPMLPFKVIRPHVGLLHDEGTIAILKQLGYL